MYKAKKIFLLGLFLFMLGSCVGTSVALAVDEPTVKSGPQQTTLIVPIPNGDGTFLLKNDVQPGTYINSIFRWGIGLAALLALGQLVLGGVLYTLSAGSITNREGATERIKSSITGLILLLISVALLVTINPNLVNISPIDAIEDGQAAIDKLTADYDANKLVNQMETNVISNPATYGKAAEAADNRLKRYASFSRFSTCVTAARLGTKIKEEIDEYVEARRDLVKYTTSDLNIAEWLDQQAGGVSGDTADFREYLNDALNAKNNKDADLYGCWQDMLISSVYYAATRIDPKSLNVMVAVFKNFDSQLEAKEYLKADPFGKKSISPDSISNVEKLFRNDYEKNLYLQLKSLVDAKNVDSLASLMLSSDDMSTIWGAINEGIIYAKQKLSPAQYDILKKKLNDDKITLKEGRIKIPN